MRLKYFQLAQSNWDAFTKPQAPLIRSEVSALGTWSPYFDPHLAWFPNAYAYFDSYAIYTSQAAQEKLLPRKQRGPSNHDLAILHPEWIAKDIHGNNLYIPWGCGGGTCPQYCGDISNAAFIQNQLTQIQALTAKGYAGIWLDDVNLFMRVCDSNGNDAVPVDSTTGKPMTQYVWATWFTQYLKKIRAAIPPYCKIVHNSIWTAPGASGEQAAADYIWIERGFGDHGMTGGDGQYSLSTLLKFIDHLHWEGAQAVFGEYYKANEEFSTACYFLANNGGDLISFDDQLPDSTWPTALFRTDLSSTVNTRYMWNGLWRRDFTDGIVLANEPGAAIVTATLPAIMADYTGAQFTSVSLSARQGKILHFIR